jgi:hypothetical protein
MVLLLVMLLLAVAPMNLRAQAAAPIAIHVKETTGIRRSTYPVNARVPFPKGALTDAAATRLMLNDREIAAQTTVESKHADDSIQWLAVDFNATIMPMEQQTYRLEYGSAVKSTAQARGLAVSETDETVQVGNVRFNKNGAPLLSSVRYRQEDVGAGPNGFVVSDTTGASHELATSGVKVEIVKRGPLYVVLRYTGKATIDAGYSVPFTVTAEMPNSKTWVKYTASVEDQGKRLRDIAFLSALQFAEFPWLWDFGTGSWTYGSFRNATDSVILTQTVKAVASGNDWQVKTGVKGQEQPYEVASGGRPKLAEGWGHLQDSKEVIAFGFDRFGRLPGTYSVAFDGRGQTSFRFAPAQPAVRHEITIYQHYVASPTPIGAVTSPVSMLNGLIATCDREQYTKAGVPVPK